MSLRASESNKKTAIKAVGGSVRPVSKAILLFTTTCLLQVGCGVPGPAGPEDSFALDFSMPADATARGAIVFIIDGVNAGIFQQMLEADQLPAFKKYFVDRGLYVPRAIAGTPSVTLANETSLVTGLFPGHHGIIGINWFDRNRLIWRNYETIAQKNTLDGDYTAATIYESFPDATTFSLFFQAHRGATKFVENWTSAGPPFFFGWYEFIDRLTLSRFDLLIDVARKQRAFPAVTVVYLLAPDFFAYRHGVSSEQYRQGLRHTDRQIGRVLGDLKRAGLLDKLVIALTSDHSIGDVKHHFHIASFLTDQVGLNLAKKRLWETTPFERRLNYYRRYAAVLYGSGDRYFALCLRRPSNRDRIDFEPWTCRPRPADLAAYPTRFGPTDLIDVLTRQPAVDAVAYVAGKNRVRVRRKTGEVEFRQPRPGGEISYHLIAGDDPLDWHGCVGVHMLDGTPHSPRAWLMATRDTETPDLPAQIIAYFRARLAGDLAVFAAPGWDFNTIHHAGHGGLRPSDMHVPLLLAGPGIPNERRTAARTVDLMPTLLTLLGRETPDNLDGKTLIEVQGVQPPRLLP
ncbi:MAG: alkaline phosphatase family protein [Planctomycetes bacterium]|nr:alkaline phosphatase family protein [Planctomycetota bacterium]